MSILAAMLGIPAPTLDDLLAGHEFGNDEAFRACLTRAIAENPHRHARDMLFICDAIYRVTKKYGEAIESTQRKAEAFIREAICAERARVAEILTHGIESGDLQSAVTLALQSELSATDAIAIMTARDSGAPIKAN